MASLTQLELQLGWLEWPGMARPVSAHTASLSTRVNGLLYMVAQGSQKSENTSFGASQSLVLCYLCSILLVKTSHKAISELRERARLHIQMRGPADIRNKSGCWWPSLHVTYHVLCVTLKYPLKIH